MTSAPSAHPATNAESKLRMLAAGPALLRELLADIPSERLNAERIAGKWTIHEHAVHLTMTDAVMVERLKAFREEQAPEIVPYQPGEDESEGSLREMDLAARLDGFDRSRAALIAAFGLLSPEDWAKRARHPEYEIYSPAIMLRHLLMHDHLHMYRIEELWLTRDGFLR